MFWELIFVFWLTGALVTLGASLAHPPEQKDAWMIPLGVVLSWYSVGVLLGYIVKKIDE